MLPSPAPAPTSPAALGRWAWAMLVRPLATLRLAAAGAVPVPELVTMALIVPSLYEAYFAAVRTGSVVTGLHAAMVSVVLNGVGAALQVLLIWASARRLGWEQGHYGQVFQAWGPVLALNLAWILTRLGPDLTGQRLAALLVDVAWLLWSWVLWVVAVRLATGLNLARAVLAVLPAILLWDVPLLALGLAALRQG